MSNDDKIKEEFGDLNKRETKILYKGMHIGSDHKEPSPETSNFMDTMKEEMKEFGKSLTEIKVMLVGMPKKILDEAEKKFAEKSLEDDVLKIKNDIEGIKTTRFNTVMQLLKTCFQMLIALGVAYLALRMSIK